MKLLSLVLLVLSALWITSTEGSYFHGHPLLVNTKNYSQIQQTLDPWKMKSEDPQRMKRQIEFNQDGRCEALRNVIFCNNGLYNDYANVFQRCNSSDFATIIEVLCISNSMGAFCNASISVLQSEVESSCDSSTCSSECRDVLTNIRSEVGCCIASIYNDSSRTLFYSPEPFNYTLWSNCGVEPVTQACPPSTVTLTKTEPDPTCSGNITSTLQLLSSTICRREYIDPFVTLLSAEGCTEDLDEADRICSVNKFGTYCSAFGFSLQTIFTAASENCQNTSICDPLCIETLNNITNTVGCCFNEEFNMTNSTVDWLSDEFWSMCNLESPGLCEQRFVDEESQEGKAN